jgi:hypothetical protein
MSWSDVINTTSERELFSSDPFIAEKIEESYIRLVPREIKHNKYLFLATV